MTPSAPRRATTARAIERAKARCTRECDVLEIGIRCVISAAAFDAYGELSDDERELWLSRDEFVRAARRVLDLNIGAVRSTLQFDGVANFFDSLIASARGGR